jgi:general secretion pathway protein G
VKIYLYRSYLGFSLIELLASVAIMGILAVVAVPFVETNVQREKERELKVALRDIRQALDTYKQATIAGKIATEADKSGYPPNLLTLVEGVDDISQPGIHKLYFLRRIPRDPFHPDKTIEPIDSWGLRSFQSPPDHPQAGDDVFDVYSTSPKIGLNGIAYSEW